MRHLRIMYSPDGGASGGAGTETTPTTPTTPQGTNQATGTNQGTGTGAQVQAAPTTPQVDYARIQKMLDGVLAAKEGTALKSYFQQQGLSQEEVETAIKTFKAEKAKNTPDPAALTQQLQAAKAALTQERIDNAAHMAALTAGVTETSIPYVLKLADFSQVTTDDGKVDGEKVKAAIDAVLEAVPAFKATTTPATPASGFKVGQGAQGKPDAVTEQLNAIFGTKGGRKMSI